MRHEFSLHPILYDSSVRLTRGFTCYEPGVSTSDCPIVALVTAVAALRYDTIKAQL